MSSLNLRLTGRTQRMLEEVQRLMEQGRYVFVIAADQLHAKNLQQRLAGMFPEHKVAGTKVYAGGGEASIEVPDERFDWKWPRFVGSHPGCEVLVDHYAVEAHWGHILRLAHRWDSPATDQGSLPMKPTHGSGRDARGGPAPLKVGDELHTKTLWTTDKP